jgi:hypothetical protein
MLSLTPPESAKVKLRTSIAKRCTRSTSSARFRPCVKKGSAKKKSRPGSS